MSNLATEQMATLASGYCELVESFDENSLDNWLTDVAELLPKLHRAVDGLEQAKSMGVYEHRADYDARFEMFTRLYQALGERNGYSYEYDGLDGQRLSGSLADDITDIYFDLKHGLSVLINDPTMAAHEWQHSYEFHWRHHLLDAERQLLGAPEAAANN